jgi:hypothetical protein
MEVLAGRRADGYAQPLHAFSGHGAPAAVKSDVVV